MFLFWNVLSRTKGFFGKNYVQKLAKWLQPFAAANLYAGWWSKV